MKHVRLNMERLPDQLANLDAKSAVQLFEACEEKAKAVKVKAAKPLSLPEKSDKTVNVRALLGFVESICDECSKETKQQFATLHATLAALTRRERRSTSRVERRRAADIKAKGQMSPEQEAEEAKRVAAGGPKTSMADSQQVGGPVARQQPTE